MIILVLPSKEKSPTHWQDFHVALAQHNLSINKVLEQTEEIIKIQINTTSEEQEEIVIDLVELCFSKSYQV